MELFEYQRNVITAILSCSSKKQLISMPTGTGKTITFLSFAKEYGKKTLIIVHREELLNQTLDKALKIGFLPSDISLFSSKIKEEASIITIAMVQTIGRNLENFKKEHFDLMIIDEAHHATADSYLKVIDYFGFRGSEKLLLGFTATPLRSDGRILSALFDTHSYKMTLSEATQLGYIVPVRGIRIEMEKSLEDISIIGNDYDISQLDKIMNCESVNKIICERCSVLFSRPGIIFTTSINHAEKLKDLLIEKGMKAESVNYKTDRKDLNSIYEKLKKGEVDFVTNAVKLSEGFDEPNIRSVIIARPTRSPILYKQMIGRGLRNYPEKHECFVLEFTSNDKNMVSWDEIDQNSTFQSFTPGRIEERQKALNFYESRFKNTDILINNVRISPFNFYECQIQRVVKYKKHFRYIPLDDGVMFFRFIPVQIQGQQGMKLRGWMFYWEKKYTSFKAWRENWCTGKNDYIRPCEALAFDKEYLDEWIHKGYLKRQPCFMGRWYPSEEEPLSQRQRSLLSKFMHKIPSYLKGRKAEFEIENWHIERIIDKYFDVEEFPYDMIEGNI